MNATRSRGLCYVIHCEALAIALKDPRGNAGLRRPFPEAALPPRPLPRQTRFEQPHGTRWIFFIPFSPPDTNGQFCKLIISLFSVTRISPARGAPVLCSGISGVLCLCFPLSWPEQADGTGIDPAEGARGDGAIVVIRAPSTPGAASAQRCRAQSRAFARPCPH